jgi:hypothetical protein
VAPAERLTATGQRHVQAFPGQLPRERRPLEIGRSRRERGFDLCANGVDPLPVDSALLPRKLRDTLEEAGHRALHPHGDDSSVLESPLVAGRGDLPDGRLPQGRELRLE